MASKNSFPGEHARKTEPSDRHPKGTRARILLSSVFGPFAKDDRFGSRAINPMELYHNQVTRVQGVFSPRRFHHSWGIRFIQENITAPCTVLDFPTRERFALELKKGRYDIVGISAITVNIWKVREMCRLTREILPRAVIIVGGHVAAVPGLNEIIDADYIVTGEGIAWLRAYLGEKVDSPLRHPLLPTGFGARVMGIKAPEFFVSAAAVIVSSGCVMGCNFCCTSSFFGGKGNMVNYYETGAALFRVMAELERKHRIKGFAIMDENFLLQKERALELMELMEKNQKSWTFNIFSSVNAVRQYSVEELIKMGISGIWLGLESPRADYAKLKGADTMQLCRELMDHGINVLGSTIIGMEHHTPENIMEEIEYAVAHETDFHQFMLYTPMPGTPLYREMAAQDRLLNDVDWADIHGQYAFNFEHRAITREESTRYLIKAFERDLERNGPSYFRTFRTIFNGWKRYHDHPNQRLKKIFRRKGTQLRYIYGPALWVMERFYRDTDAAMAKRMRRLRKELEREFGAAAAAATCLLGPLLYLTSRRAARLLQRGVTFEPKTYTYRRNWR
jgi:radical SAM superfamily enzyme YgiQ (UPF0313 family)